MILSILLLILITLSCVNATKINENDSILDISEDYTNDKLETSLNDFSTLNDEINASSQTKTLNLTKDYAFNGDKDVSYSDGITIDIDDLIIDGQGHTIDANNQARIFNIKSNNVILKNLVITNGYSKSNGGGIYWSGLNGQISNSNFKNCASPQIGGAVYFEKIATVTDSKFVNNSAYFGGAVDFQSESVMNNCEFDNNFAKYLGGGVFCCEDTKILNSKFAKNIASDGGGLYFFSTGTAENCMFEENTAIGYGGAITNENKISVKNSTFIKNNGAYAGAICLKGDGSIYCCNFTENSAAKTAGAVYTDCYDASILNSKFNHNKAEQAKSIYITNKNVRLENITFNNNPSTYATELYIECGNKTLINLTYNNIAKQESTNPSKTVVKTVTKKVTKKKTAITAKTKTFKLKKVKKYTIALKSGKTILKKKKVTLRVKGKTYTAKTNSKGKAVFKLKITKKGKFKATIKFAGDKLYKASKKTVYIKIKK